MTITRKGEPLQVEGVLPELNTLAPQFTLTDLEDKAVSLADFIGKKVLVSVFPDIDTRVCDLQTKRFYALAKDHQDLVILNVSNNSKEELKEWCITNGVDIIALRDTDKDFAKAYGLWLPEINHLARSVFVIDEKGTLVYEELVSELSHEPDYQAALKAVK